MTDDAAGQSLFRFSYRTGDGIEIGSNLTKLEYACISLKVPRTGIAEVDAVIREALRNDDARAAMQGMIDKAKFGGPYDPNFESIAKDANYFADAMAQARGQS